MFVRILAWFSGDETSSDSVVKLKKGFLVLSFAISSEALEVVPTLLYSNMQSFVLRPYLAMHVVQTAKRGIATLSRPSVCLTVCNVDVPWSYRLNLKLITRIISLGSSQLGAATSVI